MSIKNSIENFDHAYISPHILIRNRLHLRKVDRDLIMDSQSPVSGSVPLIAVTTPEEATFPDSTYLRPEMTTSDCDNGELITSERSSSEQRAPALHPKPVRPAPFFGYYRASSAENRRTTSQWKCSSSHHPLKNHAKLPIPNTSSPLSLSSAASIQSGTEHLQPTSVNFIDKNMHTGQPHVVALYDFETGIEGDLEFKVGDIIMLEDIVDESWYFGRSIRTNRVGIFPMNHVEVRIPLTCGLFTKAQPKTPLLSQVVDNNDSNHDITINTNIHQNESTIITRRQNGGFTTASQFPNFYISSNSSSEKRFGPEKYINSFSPPDRNAFSTSASRNSVHSSNLPRRPSRVRVASLNAKRDGEDSLSSTVSLQDPMNSSISDTEQLIGQDFVITSFPSQFHHSVTIRPSIQSKPTIPLPENKPKLNRSIRSSHPSMVSTLRPKTQNAVAQLAQTLQQQGVVAFRSKPMPTGAKHLYPGSHPLFVSSAPTGRSKLFGNVVEKNNKLSSDKPHDCTGPVMVETLLSKLLPELQKHTLSPSLTKVPSQNGNEPINEDDKSSSLPLATSSAFMKIENNAISSDVPPSAEPYKQKNQPKSIENVGMAESTKKIEPQKIVSSKAYIKLTHKMSKSDDTFCPSNSSQITPGQWLLVECMYKKQNSAELSVEVGDVIQCLDSNPNKAIQNNLQWIKCQNWYGKDGLIPNSVVKPIGESSNLQDLLAHRPRAEVRHKFNAETEDDLQLMPGDIIYLFEAIDENWYRGESAKTGQRGMFPASFVKVIQPL